MNQTIYFRKDVWEQFKDEADKSKLVNELLDSYYSGKGTVGRVQDVQVTKSTRSKSLLFNKDKSTITKQVDALSIPGVVKGSDFVPKPPDPETGYPCCTKNKPCKHWQWDGVKSAYVNELTGKVREVL